MKRATVLIATGATLLALGACTTMNVEVTEAGKVQATTASSALWSSTPAIKTTHRAIDAACKESGYEKGIVGPSLPPKITDNSYDEKAITGIGEAAEAAEKMLEVVEKIVGMLPEHSYIWAGRCGPKTWVKDDEAACRFPLKPSTC